MNPYRPWRIASFAVTLLVILVILAAIALSVSLG